MYLHERDYEKYYEHFKKWSMEWLKSIGLREDKLRLRDQEFKERAHYNKVATDVEYEFPYGWKEFQGIHYRGDWDLSRHGEFSGVNMGVIDEETDQGFVPHIVEYSIGLNRLMFVLLFDAYTEIENRTVLKLDKRIAPYRVAVFPLLRNKPKLVKKAREIYEALVDEGFSVAWDDRGNIGKRYLSQDEIGTPSCVTVDFQTLEDDSVTIRDRDTTAQIRVDVKDLAGTL